MRKHLFTGYFCSYSVHLPCQNIIQRYVPNAQSVGQGRLSVFVWDIYDATLYAPNGKWKQKAPYAPN